MKNVIEYLSPDYCTKCKRENILDIVDIYENHTNYNFLYSQYKKNHSVLDKLDRYILSYIKCRHCKEEYKIYWDTDNKFPIPLNETLQNIYIGNNFNWIKGDR